VDRRRHRSVGGMDGAAHVWEGLSGLEVTACDRKARGPKRGGAKRAITEGAELPAEKFPTKKWAKTWVSEKQPSERNGKLNRRAPGRAKRGKASFEGAPGRQWGKDLPSEGSLPCRKKRTLVKKKRVAKTRSEDL